MKNPDISTTDANSAITEEIAGSDVAELEETVSSDEVYTHTFSRPVEYEGKIYAELTFDFGKLTGRDSLDVERSLQSIGQPVVVRSLSGDYLIRMCAKACTTKVGHDIFEMMPVKDYTKITNKSKRFF